MKREPLTLDIRKCLRCGKNHRGMVFTPFKRETPMEFKWWAMCPKTKEPLMVSALLAGDPRVQLLASLGHAAEVSQPIGAAVEAGLLRDVYPEDIGKKIPAQRYAFKRRCPKCRRGPVIVSAYNNKEVQCHCADCGYDWAPRDKK